jgi:DNA-binding transcriptional MocR family regulator
LKCAARASAASGHARVAVLELGIGSVKSSVYLAWSKQHAAARYNLAASGIAACELGDLRVALDETAVNGANADGYGPLIDRIAAHHGVDASGVVTAEGAAMANFLALASLVERGDQVLVERPTDEPLLAALAYLGADVHRFHRRLEDGYVVDPSAVERALSARTRLIVLTSPHNPSGVATTATRLGELSRIARATPTSSSMKSTVTSCSRRRP